ncbi:MAG: GntR family transcriptional regulator [Acidimicrobiia bacterium]|nr:GntR family transcriptional regulator [Acidimicrobiia bacterium]
MSADRPRYEEIADHLRAEIARLEPGDLLPSETELSEQFGVSRMTARHAVQTLEREHLLHRRKGKGTFVSPSPVPRLLGSPLSFTESMRRRGLEATSVTLEAGFIDPSEEDLIALELTEDSKVGLLVRLRLADGTPMAIERAVLAPHCARVLDAVSEGSLHTAFEAMGLMPSRASAQVLARAATAQEKALLELDEGDPVLCERRVIYDQNNDPLEHTETRYAADRYVFDVTMYRDEGGR